MECLALPLTPELWNTGAVVGGQERCHYYLVLNQYTITALPGFSPTWVAGVRFEDFARVNEFQGGTWHFCQRGI